MTGAAADETYDEFSRDNSDRTTREVSFEEAYALAVMHGAIYAEVSARTNLNLTIVFNEHM